MKRLLAAAAILCATSAAFAFPGTFQVVPTLGVTTAQLSQARMNYIAATAYASYQAGIDAADANYRAELSRLRINPALDHSGENMPSRFYEAGDVRDQAIRDARYSAAQWANRACQGLCYSVFID